jgi:hypothetical protein
MHPFDVDAKGLNIFLEKLYCQYSIREQFYFPPLALSPLTCMVSISVSFNGQTSQTSDVT